MGLILIRKRLTMVRSCKLTIFEGCDGSGKSTAAKRYASLTGAKYVHFEAMKEVGGGLPKMYVEAMMPALLGYQDVVFDRCWISELPYGTVFRGGRDRIGYPRCKMLERLAMRCGAVVVWCDPGWEAVKRSYHLRKDEEMLNDELQLSTVYDMYKDQVTELPYITYDYQERPINLLGLVEEIECLRMPCHPTDFNTAGNLAARTVIVGDSFLPRTNFDSFYQWPFASFERPNCGIWLSEQLILAGVCEYDLLWINSDMNLELIYELNPNLVIALGMDAQTALYKYKIRASSIPHPGHFMKFHQEEEYPLFKYV